jgi:hypothetical protein
MEVAVIRPVGWRVPRTGVVLAPRENFLALTQAAKKAQQLSAPKPRRKKP